MPIRRLISRTAAAFLFLAGCSHKLAPSGHYQNTPVAADGDPSDWKLPLRFTNESYTLQYNVTNDNSNFYICVIARDVTTQLRVLRAGMTIWFDPKGAKNKDISLYYPQRKQPDPADFRSRNNPTTASGADNGIWREELLRQSDYYGTAGFLQIDNGQFAVADTKAPLHLAMKLNNNDSMLVYELVVPIKNVLGDNWQAKAAKKSISVGISLNAPSPYAGNGGHSHGGGVGGGMHGMGMRGGNMGLRRSGGSGGGGESLPKEDDNWYQFTLAVQ